MAAKRLVPLFETSIELMGETHGETERSCARVSVFHTRSVPSPPPLYRVLPSLDRANETTAPVWPVNVPLFAPVLGFHSKILASPPPLYSFDPSALKTS